MYIYAVVIPSNLLPSFINETQRSCVLSCKDDICKNASNSCRGKNYYLGGESDQKINNSIVNCRYTAWNFIHFVAFGLLTFIFPSLWAGILASSFLFEYYEFAYLDCHDINDLPANTLGVMLGYLISPFKQTQNIEY
jgi:hypothetical protein